MTQLVYTGTANFRSVSSKDFPHIEDDFEDVVWTPGSRQEVHEDVAKHLIEFHPNEFAYFEDPKKRDHRTKEELLTEATELDIAGRSKMNKEELLDAIYERRAEAEAEAEANVNEGEPAPASVEAQELDPTEGGVPHENQSVNESIGDPQGTPGTVREV